MLQRQTISMPLAQGVDTKTDAKQVVAGKLLQLENGIFTTLKAIRKRNGHEQLGNGVVNSSSTITAGAGLATFKDELLLADGSDLYSYDQSADQWVDKGPMVSVQVQQEPVQHDTFFQFNPDGVTFSNGLQVYAWSEYADPGPGTQYPVVRYKIMDSATGQTVVPSTLLSPFGNSAFLPRVIATSTKILIYYADTTYGAVRLGIIDPYDPAPITTLHDVTVVSGGGTPQSLNLSSPYFDVCVSGSSIILAFNNATALGPNGGMGVRRFLITDATTLANSTAINERGSPLTIIPLRYGIGGDHGFAIIYATGALPLYSLKARVYSEVLGSVSVITIASNLSYINQRPVTIAACQQDSVFSGGVHDQIVVYWNPDSSKTYSNPTINASINKAYIYSLGFSSPSVDVSNDWATALVIAGRPFAKATGNSLSLLPVMNRSTTQTTFWMIGDQDPSIPVAKALVGTAGNGPWYYTSSVAPLSVSFPNPPSVCQVGTAYRIVTQEAEATSLLSGAVTDAGLTSLTFEFNDVQHAYQHATLGQNLHFTGGFLQMYDGSRIVEHGFHLYPEFVTAPVASGLGGFMDPGTYQYTACYEWTDAQGNVHRSAPNIVNTEAVVPPGPSTGSVVVQVPYLQLTAKATAETLALGKTEVRIVLYRTEANGTIFYRLSDLSNPDYNQIGATPAYLSYNDTLADSDDFRKRPQLYNQFLQEVATGVPAEVSNDAAPPPQLVQLNRNRLWVLDSTSPLSLWYSKEVGPGAPVEFNNTYTKQIDPRGGNVTALASMDDKLLVFKDSHVFYILGQGPTNTNQNDDFSDTVLVTTDCGCIEPRSVVGTPFGIMFQSRKGIYLISRSMQVEYVGAPVETYNNETITSATLVANTNQVRFTLESGKTLVFDYFVQQWGVFTNQNAKDALIWMGSSVLLRPNGRVWREVPGLYTDAGAPIKLRLATSWLSFANVQGFQRVRRAQVLGAWKSPHKLKISVCNDFNDAITQELIVDPQAYLAYGESTPYGAEVYGGGFQLYQWRIDLARQKTQAVKFIIEDVAAATAGEGMSLTSLAFEVGAKTGLAKLPPGQIYG